MEYKDFIHEIKNTPKMKEKQDILDAVNLSSKMIKACLKTVEIIFDGITEINTKIHQNKDD